MAVQHRGLEGESVDIIQHCCCFLSSSYCLSLLEGGGGGGGGGASRHNSSELLGIQRGLAHGRSDISMRLKPLEVPCTAYPAGFKFKLANVLRGIEGSLSVMASFILIVQSSEIVAMFE